MPIETYCANPACRRRFLVPETTAGKSVRCKSCGETFIATASETAVGAAPARPANSAPARSADSLGATLGRFVVRERLGSGAFGTVYRALDPILDRDVALKVPNPGVMSDAKKIERFLREAKAAAGLRHPHIVAVYDAGKDRDRYYIASAFIEGKPLADSIPEKGTDFERAARLARELAEALAYAHEQGIVHRDVKPQNIMLDAQDHALLTDFGIAARLDDSRITQDGARMGTAAYMAPEQAAGQKGEAQPASDQYSAGVVLYELLTGETPFSGPPEVQIFNAIHTPPSPPRKLRPDVPRDLETICLKAMAKRREDRYADCQELADDLRRWLEGEPVIARTLSLRERFTRWVKKEPKLAGTTLALAVVLLTSVVLVSWAAADARIAEKLAEERLADLVAKQKELDELDVQHLGAVGTAEQERKKVIHWMGQAAKDQRVAEEALKAVANERTAGEAIRGDLKVAREQLEPTRKRLAGSEHRHALQMAYQAFGYGQKEVALEHLDAIPQELRSWEWGYLQKQCTTERFAERRFLLLGVENLEGLSAAKFNRDGSKVVTVGMDGTIRLWNAKSGQHVAMLSKAPGGKREPDDVAAASFSPDGSRVVTVRNKEYPRVWDAVKGTELAFLEKAGVKVQTAEFSPDGALVVTASHDDTASVWNANTGAPVTVFRGHGAWVNSATFDPRGERVVTAGDDRNVRVWEAKTGKELLLCKALDPTMKPLWVDKPVCSPDGTQVVARVGPTARMWDLKTKQEGLSFKAHTGNLRSIAFSNDGTLLVTASDDKTARVWDTVSGRPLAVLTGHTEAVASAVFSPDGQLVVTASEDKTARIWDWKVRRSFQPLAGHTKPVFTAAFSPDGTQVLTSSHDGTARIWSFGAPVRGDYTGARGWLAISPDGRRIITAGGTAGVRVCDTASGVELLAIKLPVPVNSVAWSADGTEVIAGHPDGTARVLDAKPR